MMIDLEKTRRAAEQGDASAQLELANTYYVEQDKTEAIKWCRRAAEQGNHAAQLLLGISYEKGQGVPKSYVEAYFWYNLSAAQGDESAENLREEVSKLMTQEQIAEAQRRSAEWKPTPENP